MKVYAVPLLACLSFLVHATETAPQEPKIAWSTSEGIKNPECVVFDTSTQAFYVSNIDGDGTAKDANGFISQLNASGKMLNPKWITGLNAPKGLSIRGTSLWVSDIDELVEIDIKNSKILQKIKVQGAIFLNDIATTAEYVFVSDTLGNQIYKYDSKKIEPLSTKENFESPNGLMILGNKLLVASWGEVKDFSETPKMLGRLYSVSFNGTGKKVLTKSFGNLDGLEKVKDGYIVSDWMAGRLFKVNNKAKVILISQGTQGYSDFALKEEKGKTLVVLPHMIENKVLAFEL